jgi:ADP-ribosyl-[dinitrogen reductase] hydrolase
MDIDENKIYGMFIGGALGDALGAPYEFRHCKVKFNGDIQHQSSFLNRYKNTEKFTDIGQITDDTEMHLCIMDSIIKKETFDKKDIISSYLEWANNPTTFAMGKNTRDLFKGVKTIKGYQNRFDKNFKNNYLKNKAQSNGAMMRCGIFSLYGLIDNNLYKNFLKEDCYITNPNLVCYHANLVITQMIIEGLKNNNKNNILEKIVSMDLEEPVKNVINNSIKLKYMDLTRNKGWCLKSLYITIYCFVKFNSYTEAINYIIKQKGDTDTNACIASYVLGAYYGYNKVKKEQINNLNKIFNCTTENGDFIRSEKYKLNSEKKFKKRIKSVINTIF